MDGQARAAAATPPENRSRLDDGGYILVALLVGIAIASVWMAAALPSWRQQVIREREAELIFRGQQYARAIRLYQQQMGGALPSSFDDLVSQHMLRHKWKDPITGDEFLPKVSCLQVGVIPGGVGRGGSAGITGPGGRTGGLTPQNSPPNAGRNPLSPAVQQQLPQGLQQPPGRGQQGGGQLPSGFGQTPQGGICGVQSKSNETSIKIYNGQQEYDLWQFDITTAALQYQQSIMKFAGVGASGQGVGVPMNGSGGLPGATPRGSQFPGGARSSFDRPFPGDARQPGGQGSGPQRGPGPSTPRLPPSGPGGRGRN
jgi:type II secretory pathway pseudopilin PulG